MPGWEISRHPEWEQMFAAGITVREIADLVHYPRATVHLHLQVREQYLPGLHVLHEAAKAGRVPGWPLPRWRDQVSDLKYFVLEHGRGPQPDGTPSEVVLCRWLVTQRKQDKKGVLHPAKVAALTAAWTGWRSPA